jgi:MFS family permease
MKNYRMQRINRHDPVFPAMKVVTLLLAFVPWIGFTIVADSHLADPLTSLTWAFITGIVLTVLTSYRQLLKGYILSVVTIAFFVVFFILIIVLKVYWIADYLSLLSMLIMAIVCWITMVLHFPFTLQYSREGVEPERARSAPFMHVNYIITAVWGIAFTLGFGLNAYLLLRDDPSTMFWSNLQWALIIISILFTVWYPGYVHRQRALHAAEEGGSKGK